MLNDQTNALNFKNIPKVLNISGASSFSRTSTPYSDRTAATSVTNTPLSGSIVRVNTNSAILKRNKLDGLFEVNSPSIQRKKQKPYNFHICPFCEESLHNIFEGEKLVDLQCGHILHFECFKELINIPNFYNNGGKEDYMTSITFKNEIFCSYCNITTCCIDDSLITNIQNNLIMKAYDETLTPKDEMKNIMMSLDNFELQNISTFCDDLDVTDFNDLNNEINVDNFTDELNENPITPQSQIGMKFWEKQEEISTDNLNDIDNLVKQTHANTPTNNDIELAKLIFAPEYSSVNINDPDQSSIGCVINVLTTEFENTLESNKKEQIKMQIGKNKITNNIINNFDKNLPDSKLDFSNMGSLTIFDLIDVTIKVQNFSLCQVYLFESQIIILNYEGNQLILSQELNSEIFMSSIFENENEIIINLNSIKIPSIILTSNDKILRHKWFLILTKISKKIQVSNSIPLIQISTNAWNLLDNDDNNDVIPDDIKIFNKLTSKGLDLPSGFLKRQILRPDSYPMVLILALPLVNSEDYGIENAEFAVCIKNILSNVLSSLNPMDKLGVVFLGSHVKKLTTIGNYYGCIGKDWEGWNVLLDSITGAIIAEEDNLPSTSQWDVGLDYIELLSNIGFNNFNNKNIDSVHQILCISNELLLDDVNNIDGMDKDFITIDSDVQSKLLRKKTSPNSNIQKRILQLCKKFDSNFNFILLADEFRFDTYQIQKMNRYLKQRDCLTFEENIKFGYSNDIKILIALDFENLQELLERKIEEYHKIIIKKLETTITFPKYVSIKSFESTLGKVEVFSEGARNDEKNNFYTIVLRNLPSGFEKSLLFDLKIDFSDNSICGSYKAVVANAETNLFTDKLASSFKNQAEIKMILNKSDIESNITLNLNIEKINNSGHFLSGVPLETETPGLESILNVPIISRLSSVSDAYYVRKKIQLLIKETLCSAVLDIENFDPIAKENAKEILQNLNNIIWELANSCNSSNTNNMKDNNIEEWSSKKIEKIEDIINGYSLRNYQLSNIKCLQLFLSLD